jgi:hypothetical protein
MTAVQRIGDRIATCGCELSWQFTPESRSGAAPLDDAGPFR